MNKSTLIERLIMRKHDNMRLIQITEPLFKDTELVQGLRMHDSVLDDIIKDLKSNKILEG